MQEPGGLRRLAAIVAIDVAGYSARTEADEAASAAEIAALRSRINAACAQHGGRLFNSAGDGFMLEFPTASGALEAAEDLAGAPGPPIRIGVHVGEVGATPAGDLLGHGVNVAARIQALAPPGGVLASADVKRAVRGPLADRLVRQGQTRLDKMSETIVLYALTGAGGTRARLAWRRLRAPLGVLALIVLIAGGGAWLWRRHLDAAAMAQSRVAVLPFEVQADDPRTRAVADGVADEIASVLTSAQMLTVSPDQTASLRGPDRRVAIDRLGVALVLDGSVSREGDVLRVNVRIDDAREHVVLWSQTFTGAANAPSALETDVASHAADLAGFAQAARRSPGGRSLPASVMSRYLQANNDMAFGSAAGSGTAIGILKQIIAEAPNFARGHSTLAVASGVAARVAEGDERKALIEQARGQATLALAMEPKDGEAYQALAAIVPQDDQAEQEQAFLRGLQQEPGSPYLNNTYSYMLASAGRLNNAIATAQKGLAGNALHPGAHYKYAIDLADAGQWGAARAAADETFRIHPADWTDLGRLTLAMIYGAPQEARSLLARSQDHPFSGEAPALKAWAAYLAAREMLGPAKRIEAIAAIKTGVAQGAVRVEQAIPALSSLGDLDGAFALASGADRNFNMLALDVLFSPAATPLRQDARFWPLMARLGLVRYWTASGHWPDFCGAGSALAGCKAKAAAAGVT